MRAFFAFIACVAVASASAGCKKTTEHCKYKLKYTGVKGSLSLDFSTYADPDTRKDILIVDVDPSSQTGLTSFFVPRLSGSGVSTRYGVSIIPGVLKVWHYAPQQGNAIVLNVVLAKDASKTCKFVYTNLGCL